MRSFTIGLSVAFCLVAACGDDSVARVATHGSGGAGGTGGYVPQGSGGYVPQGSGGYVPQGSGGYTVPQGSGGYGVATGGAGSLGTGGAGSLGTGGTTLAATGGSAGAAGGPLGTPTGTATGSIALTGGYYTSGTFKGYLYTAAGTGSSITPPCGTGACFTTTACVAGTVPKVSSSTAYTAEWGVLVGWNLAQEAAPPNPANATVLDGKTIKVTLSTGAAPLPTGMRVKVTSGGVEYCTDLTGATAAIPVSSLKKECWTPGGAALPAGSQISAVAVQVISDGASDKKFDFCLSALAIE